MKIISWNVNGIRAIYKNKFLDWFKKTNPDILCLQEVKANPEQLSGNLVKTKNYHSYFNSAFKKGYSGVAVYTKEKPDSLMLIRKIPQMKTLFNNIQVEYYEGLQ